MPRLIGVDGCRGGWLVVQTTPPGQISWAIHAEAEAFIDQGGPELPLVAIDMPIGLAEAGPRPCDRLARQRLGPRRSSVFPAPVRAVLGAADYPDACGRSQAACGQKLSKQAYYLLPKIQQLDRLLRADPGRIDRVHEVHPELAFAQWNGGEPMAGAKRTAGGRAQRLALVEQLFPGVPGAIRSDFPRALLADDDILDALACLWSCRRIYEGTALALGGEIDGQGLPMRIQA
ncbi:DUF429 domain-containing protein [Cyanobium sp. HWJ4-Hawea]|uniref:DUF429 domain-containing protein n=1 Tax=Cyanobium sp. HWJ4-Hawea TaxID=2823713 RepID=UPI0020CB9329|nr:DUF429 domain-containing protein [Cyanobium sp. HWJ4-Hawea]MCP9808427.1 DUF429 domain-containing protein [Cyanobium sp. HWJ4-Hawea]